MTKAVFLLFLYSVWFHIAYSQSPADNQCSDPNAERVKCAVNYSCRATCEESHPGPCTSHICIKNDCVCKKGYVLSVRRGKCISPKDCPRSSSKASKCSDPNAERVKCALAENCRATCEKPNPGPCPTQICIKNDCVCKKGFVLLERGGKCVATNECRRSSSNTTKCRDPNAERVKCALDNNCRATCKKPNPGHCLSQICIKDDCVCKKGYVLLEKGGKCVARNKCPTQCGKGEVYTTCGSACKETCHTRGNTCLVCPAVCFEGCVCAGNTIRAPDGSCVPPEKCPKRTCPGPNEIFDECPSSCPWTQKCDHIRSNKPCKNIDCCSPECRCKPGFYRNKQFRCVTKEECTVCAKGQVYTTCGSACTESCRTRGNTCLGCPAVCVEGCFCAGNTTKAPDGSCVPPEECPKRTCSGPNEIFDECPPTCPRTQKCENLWSKIPCTDIDCCAPQCRCKPGFYRNRQNRCVSAKECRAKKSDSDN